MLVSKWGESLAVRLSAEDVARLDLKEGDEVVVEVKRAEMQVSPQEAVKRREEALERLRGLRGLIPAGFKFDRDEANSR